MRDPIDELENFDPGPAMNPMPAADVRRRGDRIRRRNNALATVGGLAAVAALAVPFAVFAGGQSPSSDPQPAPAPPVEWVQEIPEDFPLTDQLPASTKVRDGYEMQHVPVCGDSQTWSADGTTDARQAAYTGETEGGWDRTIGVYPTDREAARELMRVSAAAAACAVETEDAKQRWVELAQSDAGDESVAYANVMSDAGDMFVVRLVRVGNAILQDSTYAFGGGDPRRIQEGVDLVTEKSAGVVDAMCVFSEDGCAGSDDGETAEDPTIGEGAVPAIPADFPLGEGLPTGGEDGTVPSPEPGACGETVPEAPEAVDTAHAQWRDLAEIRDRQLLTFASQAEAEAYVQRVVGVYCVEEGLGGGATRVSRVYPGQLGDYSAAAVSHNEVDGEVDPGLYLTEVVRVGRAVLLYQRIDEGYTFTDDVDRASTVLMDEGFTELEPVVDAMCTFTVEGC